MKHPTGDFANIAPYTILLVELLAALQQREEFHHIDLTEKLAKLVQNVRITEKVFPALRAYLFERLLDVVKHIDEGLVQFTGDDRRPFH